MQKHETLGCFRDMQSKRGFMGDGYVCVMGMYQDLSKPFKARMKKLKPKLKTKASVLNRE